MEKLNAIPNIRGRALSIPANVGHTDQIQRFVADVETEVRKTASNDGKPVGVDILIANAASSWGGPFEDFEDWKSQKTLDLNVRAVFNLVRLSVSPCALFHPIFPDPIYGVIRGYDAIPSS